MKQVMNYHKDNGLLNMIRRTDPMIMGSETFTDYEVIGHELKHAYDFQNGIASSDKDANGVEYDEYRAVQFENLIRKEEKRPMRTTYGKHPVPQKYLNQQ